MYASEYIAKLQALINEYGDMECVDSYDEQIGDPEYIEGSFVLAFKA